MKRIVLIAAGIVGVLVGLGFIMPAVANHGSTLLEVMLPRVLGGAFVVGGLIVLVKGVIRSRA